MYLNSFSSLYDTGVLPFEFMLRACGIATLIHAYKHGNLLWLVVTFMVALGMEKVGVDGHAYCKAESIIMLHQCNELSLHASFWLFWHYPWALASFRLGLPCATQRIACTALLVFCNGVSFDLSGAATELWAFSAMTETTLWVATTMWPGAYAQHLYTGIGVASAIELLRSREHATGFEYPSLSYNSQLAIGSLIIPLSYVPFQMFLGLPTFVPESWGGINLQVSLVLAPVPLLLFHLVRALYGNVQATWQERDVLLGMIPLSVLTFEFVAVLLALGGHKIVGWPSNLPPEYPVIDYKVFKQCDLVLAAVLIGLSLLVSGVVAHAAFFRSSSDKISKLCL